MPMQSEQGPNLNAMLDDATSGCVGELLRLIITGPFKIVRDILRYKGSLIIWPIPILLIIVCAVNQQYGAMITIIIFAIIITYIAKWIGNMVKWNQLQAKGGKSPLEKELDKIASAYSRGRISQEDAMSLRASAMYVYSPGTLDQLNDMRARNVISEAEYVRLRDSPINGPTR
jgi:hypothetical protein